MAYISQTGIPTIGTERTATPRQIMISGERYLPGMHIIDGSESRDIGNTPITELRAGILLGKRTTGDFLAPAILGASDVLHDTSVVTVTMTLPAAVVTEIQRRQGASGTFNITGPPAANGVVVTELVTYSAIASATTITITATADDFAAGSFIQSADGSQTILTFIPDGYPIRVTDVDGTAIETTLPKYPIGGLIDSSQLIEWPTDTSLQAWIVAALNASGTGQFVFDHKHI